MNAKILILTLISIGSLLWGISDLRRKRDSGPANRIQSWAQVAAGLIGLGFLASYLLTR